MYDIILINPTVEEYQEFKIKFPIAKKAEDFRHAQKIAMTDFFWVIWNDCKVLESFDFSYVPDDWSKQYIHVFLNNEHYDGICLVPKKASVSDNEITYRFFINKKEVNIQASVPTAYDQFNIDTYEEYLSALENSKTEMFWMLSKNLQFDNTFIKNFYVSHYDFKLNHAFIHQVNNTDYYTGVFLCTKHRPLTQKEVEHRFIVNRKEWPIVASGPIEYDQFNIDNYEEYLAALENTKTDMFWMLSRNIKVNSSVLSKIYVSHDSYDSKVNHAFIHRVDGQDLYNGVFLCSKHKTLTQREVEHRFIVNRKEWPIVASGPIEYDRFNITTYEEYLSALKNSKTEMFWIIPNYVIPSSRFKFDTYFSHDNEYDRKTNHAFLNGKYNDGIVLCSKHSRFSKREFDYRFIANKKEVNIIISTPVPYDIVFISYQEPNADQHYQHLIDRFPRAKRIHGITGIHQAHIKAATLCSTDLFWIVDGDAVVDSNFKFDYQVARWDRDMVHVWRSVNPINDLVYGYGGVKLFPTELTINMDLSKPDMTTSISSKFKAVQEISNVTNFNTDPFNTWKSAFRECTKLSSKVIDRQKDVETQLRLEKWCTLGIDRPFGKYAIDGAKFGALFGTRNKDNIEVLKKINDFNWLKEQFDARNI
jgi:hypothetical protein